MLEIACRALSVIHYLRTSANYTIYFAVNSSFCLKIREHKPTSDSESSAKRIYVTRTKLTSTAKQIIRLKNFKIIQLILRNAILSNNIIDTTSKISIKN